MIPPTPGPPPGWYPDPAGGGGSRWWDGYGWSHATAPPAGAATVASTFGAPSPGPARHLVDGEREMSPWGRRAVVALPLAAIASAVLLVAYAAEFAAFFHFYRELVNAAGTGAATPTLPANARIPWEIDLPALVSIPAEIVLLVWQFRAATAARWLGLPARRTPGWGVAFWFIPIANFWCPYQAIRDCLPPSHPDRGLVLWFWLAWIGAGLVNTATFFAAPFSRPAGVGLLAVAVVLLVATAVLGYRIVTAIEDTHRAMVDA